jgi:hypothetical protein
MKLTEKRLRQIIREERNALIKESPEALAFYRKRVALLQQARQHLSEAINALADVSDLDLSSPSGEDTDVMSAAMDIQSAQDFVEGIIDATEAMVHMGSGG